MGWLKAFVGILLSASESIKIIKFMTLLLFLQAALILLISKDVPITDWHSFRQTQTALTSYWFINEGFRLDYQTPVIGYPWSIPFEFPTFQILAAAVSMLGIELDFAGRLVSFCFFVACLWPLKMISQDLKLGSWWYWSMIAMLFASPLYVTWSRAFMIETTALFFSICHISFLIAFFSRRRSIYPVISVIFGILAALTKSTTLPGFSVVGAFFVFLHGAKYYLSWQSLRKVQMGIAAGVLLTPYLPAVAWIEFTDAIKQSNEIGAFLTSEMLSLWNYGTLGQRFSSTLWVNVFGRILADVVGLLAVPGFVLLLIISALRQVHVPFNRSDLWLLSACLLGFGVPILLFTNLHMVHDYYQVANAIFLISGIAVLVQACARANNRSLAFLLLVLVLVSQNFRFYSDFFPKIFDPQKQDSHTIALLSRDLTPENTGLLVVGEDWNSTIAYYSERKALSIPNWMEQDLVARALRDTENFLGGLPLGGVVVCGDIKNLRYAEDLALALQNRKILGKAGKCKLFNGDD
ncbi:hypothetical protein OAW29_03030 [Planktomarina temperata]|nr:hypothetical protein [Planktomarina temperata]